MKINMDEAMKKFLEMREQASKDNSDAYIKFDSEDKRFLYESAMNDEEEEIISRWCSYGWAGSLPKNAYEPEFYL